MGASTKGSTGLEPGWTLVEGTPVYHRSRVVEGSAATILHVHGFAISGSYMVPTAELLADEFTTRTIQFDTNHQATAADIDDFR